MNATEASVEQTVPVASTVSNLNVRLNGSPGAGNSYTFVLRKSAVDTAVTCAISDAATTCSDAVNSAVFAAGDRIAIRVTPASGPTARSMNWTAVRSP